MSSQCFNWSGNMLVEWVREKLEQLTEQPRIVIKDPLKIISSSDSGLKEFVEKNNFIVIFAATNLVFRELYFQAIADPTKEKVLLVDQTPQGRITQIEGGRAPPLFYPDILKDMPTEALVRVDLYEFLMEKTGDSSWPREVNNRRYARLILKNLKGIIEAHHNLRIIDSKRFTDEDLRKIVAFASLGISESAFKTLSSGEYWKIGLSKSDELKELSTLTPAVVKTIKDYLSISPKPFCWFADHDPDLVIRGFYLSLVLSQYFEDWKPILGSIEPGAHKFCELSAEELRKYAPDLIRNSPQKANSDLEELEQSLNRDAIKVLLIDKLNICEPDGFVSVLRREKYSIMFRSLALLVALRDCLLPNPSTEHHEKIYEILFGEQKNTEIPFVDERVSASWIHLKEAYRFAYETLVARNEMRMGLKTARVKGTEKLDFIFFWNLWNEKKVNRLEYYLSSLERIIDYSDDLILPRDPSRLPLEFTIALDEIKTRIKDLSEKEREHLDELNLYFQSIVRRDYPKWIEGEKDLILTSQFIKRLLKPHWDPEKEDAVILIFDGMRYDIWEEMLKPLLLESMKLIEEKKGCSLLPSETKISRNAISAGLFPDECDLSKAENKLLKESLAREFRYEGEVVVNEPDGLGIGQTVRYKADSLEMYIFEFCDKGLHHITIKKVGDKDVPSRSLAHIYQQQFKDFIEHEVLSITRKLRSGTKVFITADHGFGLVGRNKIWFKKEDLNDPYDCNYLNCKLPISLSSIDIPHYLKSKIIEFTPAELRIPEKEEFLDRRKNTKIEKNYKSVAFPSIGYAFSRPDSPFNPDAYSHGGISIQELLIPMVVLEVKKPDKGLISFNFVKIPDMLEENEEALFRVQFNYTPSSTVSAEDIRINLEARYSHDLEKPSLRPNVIFLPPWSKQEIDFRFTFAPEEITSEERRCGTITRSFVLMVSYSEGDRKVRKTLSHEFTIRVNSERIVRRVGNLGSILGLTPKSGSNRINMG